MPVNLGDWCRRLSGMVVLPYLEGPIPLSAGSRNTIRRRLLALDRCGDELVVACPRENNHGHLESTCHSQQSSIRVQSNLMDFELYRWCVQNLHSYVRSNYALSPVRTTGHTLYVF